MNRSSTKRRLGTCLVGGLFSAALAIMAGCARSPKEPWGDALSGTILQHEDTPLPGGEILFYPDAAATFPPRQAIIGEDGTYSIRLAPGTYWVAVNNDVLRTGITASLRMPPQMAKVMKQPTGETVPEQVRGKKLPGKWMAMNALDQRPDTSGLVCTVNPDTHVFDVRLRKP